MKRVNKFMAMGSEKVEEEKESDTVDEYDEAELKKLLVIKKDEDIVIDAIPLATKLPVIIDYKLHKEGLLQGIDKEELGSSLEDSERKFWVTIWKLIDSSGVHFVRRNLKIQMMNIKFRGGLLGLKRLYGFLEVTAAQPNNNNGWIEADVPLLGELGVVADELMVGLIVDEIVKPIVEAEEQVIAPVVDMDEDIAMLFGDDDFEDDDSEGFDEEEVWEVNEEWLMAPATPPPMPAVPPPSVYEVGGPSTDAAEGQSFPLLAPGLPIPPLVIEDLSTRLDNLEYGHGQLVKKVIQVSDVEVATGISIGEIGSRVFAIEGQVQALQAAMQQRDTQIQQLQTTVLEMNSEESTLMQCILRMDRRLADLERRPPGPQ
ncbi:hypothetical protein Tco_0134095 [Tanacetum coccineum]